MRKIFFFIISILTIILLWINIRLYGENFTREEKQKDIELQLNFLGSELKNHELGNRMQAIFPEGFVFINALYGLSWCELAISNPSFKDKAIQEAMFAYKEIDSDHGKSVFDSNLFPAYGIYYVGWNNYLLSKMLMFDSTSITATLLKKKYIEQCEIISKAVSLNETPYLPSYYEQTWPADICVAMASLKNHDHIFPPKYQSQIGAWIKIVKAHLDPITKMIPHKVDANTGEIIEGSRGCSISLILRAFGEIDKDFASEQYALYKTNFIKATLGLPSISEYPKGQSGPGDIDSGPVIMGVGFAGTIVAIGTSSIMGDEALSDHLYKTIHAFGFSYTSNNEKKYILGKLPIADAFIAWGRSTSLNTAPTLNKSFDPWRWKFQLLSLLFLGFLWSLVFGKVIFNKLWIDRKVS